MIRNRSLYQCERFDGLKHSAHVVIREEHPDAALIVGRIFLSLSSLDLKLCAMVHDYLSLSLRIPSKISCSSNEIAEAEIP